MIAKKERKETPAESLFCLQKEISVAIIKIKHTISFLISPMEFCCGPRFSDSHWEYGPTLSSLVSQSYLNFLALSERR